LSVLGIIEANYLLAVLPLGIFLLALQLAGDGMRAFPHAACARGLLLLGVIQRRTQISVPQRPHAPLGMRGQRRISVGVAAGAVCDVVLAAAVLRGMGLIRRDPRAAVLERVRSRHRVRVRNMRIRGVRVGSVSKGYAHPAFVRHRLLRAVLRRALSVKNGNLLDFKNEYLSVKDYLSAEEIAGRDEEILFDPYLRSIIKSRKDDVKIRDIIETIQEKQFEIITLPEGDEFVLQGVAGSGKTMILLHRLSYIMYNNESVRPSDVLVITPSNSFNAFIDELSAVLELEKVRTSTLSDYFINLLKSADVDISKKVDYNAPVPEDYLKYIYSSAYSKDVERKLSKIFDGIYGLFASADCLDTVNEVKGACAVQIEEYEKIKNSSLRIRR